jgi:RNA-binding motif X-linked protein 2
MNPLTQIKNTQKASQREIAQGVGDSASWHAKFKHSAYVFAGGLSYDLTEGDLLAVFAQYGEIVDVNLVRDKDTGQCSVLVSPPPLALPHEAVPKLIRALRRFARNPLHP